MDDEIREHVYDYSSMYEEDAAEKIPPIPTWILHNLTVPQMQQIRNTWRKELYTGNRQTTLKLYELMTFK